MLSTMSFGMLVEFHDQCRGMEEQIYSNLVASQRSVLVLWESTSLATPWIHFPDDNCRFEIFQFSCWRKCLGWSKSYFLRNHSDQSCFMTTNATMDHCTQKNWYLFYVRTLQRVELNGLHLWSYGGGESYCAKLQLILIPRLKRRSAELSITVWPNLLDDWGYRLAYVTLFSWVFSSWIFLKIFQYFWEISGSTQCTPMGTPKCNNLGPRLRVFTPRWPSLITAFGTCVCATTVLSKFVPIPQRLCRITLTRTYC